MQSTDVFIIAAVRTAIGTFGGSLKDIPLSQLATKVVSEALRRSGVDPAAIDHIVMGNVIPTEPRDAYLSRYAAIKSGIPKEVPAFNVNRLCGSGLQALVSAAQSIKLGDASIAIAGGAESMSRGPYILDRARWGIRMGDSTAVDYMLGILHDPFDGFHMGITAENIAQAYKISREMQDTLALESQRRAAIAITEGRFKKQITPFEIVHKRNAVIFDTDEHVRADATAAQLAKMKPAFKGDGGTVTAGNSSGINDGAAALVMAGADAIRRHGLHPMARLVSYAHAGVDPSLMGMGPVPATQLALQRAGLNAADLDVIESNEAFAAQACAVIQSLGLDPAKVNPNGSGISLGHPVGATGAIISTKAIFELHRTAGRYALVTMCIGGGQGIAAIFERV